MGAETFYKYQKEFGFGQDTGIDLPGEPGVNTWNRVMHALSGMSATVITALQVNVSFMLISPSSRAAATVIGL